MKLKGKEKFFWERNFNIKKVANIPSQIEGIRGIDSEHDDDFFFYLTSRVHSVGEIVLRCTNVTDKGVDYISTLKNLRQLTLKDHRGITKACLPGINKLTELEYLDISKNDISIEDLYTLTSLKKLKQLFISSDKPDREIAEELDSLKKHFPGCEVTVY
jgi:Leucine-rich repeat (LRR) protein